MLPLAWWWGIATNGNILTITPLPFVWAIVHTTKYKQHIHFHYIFFFSFFFLFFSFFGTSTLQIVKNSKLNKNYIK
jgi:hypothetical protein